jgi:hypothetical protein
MRAVAELLGKVHSPRDALLRADEADSPEPLE